MEEEEKRKIFTAEKLERGHFRLETDKKRSVIRIAADYFSAERLNP